MKAFHHDSDRVPHTHDFVELVYVLRGSAIHEYEAEQYPIRSGDVFIINPDEVHTYRIKEKESLDIINCLFTPALISESLLHELRLAHSLDFLYVLPFLDSYKRFHHHLLRLNEQESKTVHRLLERMMEEIEEASPGYQSLIMMELIELLVLLSRYHKKKNEPFEKWGVDMRARRICGYLERHAYQPINVDSIACLFHISTRQLHRILIKETGLSLMEIVHHLRVEQAKKLLRQTNATIITVAAQVGYESPSFF